MAKIRAVTSYRGFDFLAGFGMRSDDARQAQQLERPFEIEIVEVLGDARAFRFLALAQLDIGAEAAALALHRQAGFGVFAHHAVVCAVIAIRAAGLGELAGVLAFRIVGTGDESAVATAAQRQPSAFAAFAFAQRAMARILAVGAFGEKIIGEETVEHFGHFRRLLVHHLFGLGLEIAPEGFEQFLPVFLAVGNDVELVLQASGVVEGDVLFEEPLKKRRQQPARFLCEETVFLHPHIVAIAQRLDRASVSRRATDAEFLEPLDQAGFRKARGRLGEMLVRLDPALQRRIALGYGRKQAVFIVVRIVAAFLVDRQEAGVFHNLSGGTQFVLAGGVAHGDGRAFQAGGGHLAGRRTLENKIVQLALVTRPGAVAVEIGRADGFVRFLGVLRLGLVHTRAVGQRVSAIAVGNRLAASGNGAAIHADPVGTHVGDGPGFIERLGEAHGVAGGKTELARGFLLQGRRGERGSRVALERLGLDLLDGEVRPFDRLLGGHGAAFIAQRQLFELLAIELDEARVEFRAVVLQLGDDGPVFVGPELFDLDLAIDDQPQGDRLHAARAFRARQAAPQHGRKREAVQIVERAAR